MTVSKSLFYWSGLISSFSSSDSHIFVIASSLSAQPSGLNAQTKNPNGPFSLKNNDVSDSNNGTASFTINLINADIKSGKAINIYNINAKIPPIRYTTPKPFNIF